MTMKTHVITPTFKDKQGFRMCARGIEDQDTDFFWHIVLDGNELEEAFVRDLAEATAQPYQIYKMPTVRGALNSFLHASRFIDDPDAVLITMDGDDWFIRPDAVSRIMHEYISEECWMTYGSWVSNRPNYPLGLPAYPEGTTDFRHMNWFCTQVRTCKKWLLDLVKDEDLKDENNEHYRWPSDWPLWFPMIEMATTKHAVHIPDILMMYNRTSIYSMPSSPGRTANEQVLREKTPYEPLPARPVSE